MDVLLHFSADTYSDLTADLIVRNKIDSVSCDLNHIIKAYEQHR